MYLDSLPYFCNKCANKHRTEEGLCKISFKVKKYKKGDLILHHGMTINSVYFLMQGKVVVQHKCNSGSIVMIERLEAPHPLAAFIVFSEKTNYIVDVYAITDCEVYIFTKESLQRKMFKCREFLNGFVTYNSNRAVLAYEKIILFSLKGIRAKIAFYILSIENESEFKFDMTVSDKATMFGAERPSVSRTLTELVKDGIIEFNRGSGRIIDREALALLS